MMIVSFVAEDGETKVPPLSMLEQRRERNELFQL